MHQLIENKEKYRILCEDNDDIPLFLQAWWMDAVCVSGEWGVLFYEERHEISAFHIVFLNKKMGLNYLIQPRFTQFTGCWFLKKKFKSNYEKIGFEKKVISYFLTEIEKYKLHFYEQCFHSSFTNWLPFYWRGYKQTTRYTYQIQDISEPEKCLSEFSREKLRNIKKATGLILIDDFSKENFYQLASRYHSRDGGELFYTSDFFYRVYDACHAQNQGRIFAIKDADEQVHAALFLVWDNLQAYYLIAVMNPKFRASGANSLLVYEAIQAMSGKVKIFDFAGSMIENVEHSNRQFNAVQVPYFQIDKTQPRALKLLVDLLKK